MRGINITKEQTNFIKGVGILLIVFHNYFHWVAPNPGQNELYFESQQIQNVFGIISNSYKDIINLFFSYLGHYGVQLFIFISGYGLAKSFSNKKTNYYDFIKKRVYNLYPPFIIAIILFIVYNFIFNSQLPTLGFFRSIFYKLLMIHTIIPNQTFSGNGPWWFYGLIFQLYLLFIPLFYLIKKWKLKGVLAVSLISYILIFIFYQVLFDTDILIMANAPGHIPEFTLGILLALHPNYKLKKWIITLSLLIFILGNFYFSFYPFTFIIATCFLLGCSLFLYRKQNKFSNIIIFYGKISAYLFAIHGFFRRPVFVNLAETTDSRFNVVLIGVTYLIVVTITAFVCREIYFKQKSIIIKS